MNNITVLIETHNEEKYIEDCLTSARMIADTILVVDMESTDKTQELAQTHGATVFTFPYAYYVEPARAFGIQKVQTDWIFILDADERITQELAVEIRNTIKHTKHTHFKVPRKNIFGGQTWLKHGGWWPDEQVRLIKTSAFNSWPSRIHSTPHVSGSLGHLHTPFLHLFHGNVHQMVEKTLIFENIEADLLFEAHKPVQTRTFFRKFFGELWKRLIQKQGFLDGTVGIMESVYQAFSKTITYILLYEKKNSRTLHPLS
jgi:glycosyltransferase involved in cell wall biosynthesis